jgi:hypothetical protein
MQPVDWHQYSGVSHCKSAEIGGSITSDLLPVNCSNNKKACSWVLIRQYSTYSLRWCRNVSMVIIIRRNITGFFCSHQPHSEKFRKWWGSLVVPVDASITVRRCYQQGFIFNRKCNRSATSCAPLTSTPKWSPCTNRTLKTEFKVSTCCSNNCWEKYGSVLMLHDDM